MASYSSRAFPPLRQVRKVPRNTITLLGPLAMVAPTHRTVDGKVLLDRKRRNVWFSGSPEP
jgi:hypothetical protein